MAPKPQGSSAPAGPAPVAVGGSVLHPPAPSVPSLTEPKAQMAESPVYTGRMTPAAVGIPAEKKPMAASVVDTGDQPSDKISSELSKKRTKAKPDVKENLGLRRERDRSKQESVDIMDEERATSRMAVYGSPQHFRSPSIADPMLSNTGPDEQAELRRKGVVRYYRQMNPHKLFPLLVSIIDAQRYIKHTDLPGVTHAESDTALTIQQKSPRVRIVPILPGCTIYPPELEVDVRSEKVDAEFWLTPQVEGDLRNSARVQIWYQGELQDQIPIPCQIRAQTLTKISAFFSVISPVTGAFLENYGTQAANNGEGKLGAGGYVLQKLLSLLSSSGIWIGIFFLLIAFLCYLWLRPKRGDDVEQFLKTDLH
jgi:hypothetical protein